MKPRNNFERELQRIIDRCKINPLTPKQMQQAHDIMDKDRKYRLWLFNTEQVYKGMKLTKCYKAHRYGRGLTMTMFHLVLVKAEKDGKTAWAGRMTNMGFIDSFSYYGDITIKRCRWWYENYITHNHVLRSTGKCDEYAVVRHIAYNDYEFRDSRVETIAKAGGEGLIRALMIRRKAITPHLFSAFKVANRHGYNFGADCSKWVDYVNLQRKLGRDCHNPHYLCPDDINEAYHRAVDEYDRRFRAAEYKARKEEEMRQFEEAMKYNDRYVKEHRRWLAVMIVGNGMTIQPLKSVNEFYEEGNAMHHCVFKAGYYKMKDKLILSARDSEGRRIATIDYDLKKREVMQCRAACNGQPERYEEICNLVNKNFNENIKKV